MGKKLKVLWLTNIPSPYRVDFFNELGKYCDLTVLFEKRASGERNKSWENYTIENFKAVFLRGISVGVAESVCPGIIKYLDKNSYDRFFVTNYSDITGMLAIAIMKMRRIPYIIEGDGAFAGTGHGIKEKIKNRIISDAILCFSTAGEHDKYYSKYGAKEIRRYPFTSIKEKDLLKSLLISNEDKAIVRKQLRIFEKNVVLVYGDFWQSNLFKKNCEIIEKLVKGMSLNTGIYLIGERFCKEYVQWSGDNDNLHLVVNEDYYRLTKYYVAADALVILNNCDSMTSIIEQAIILRVPVIASLNLIKDNELNYNNVCSYLFDLDKVLIGDNTLKLLIKNETTNIKIDFKMLSKMTINGYSNTGQSIWGLRNIVRELRKEKLGITEKKVILSVGQFIYRKGYDILIDAAKQFDEDVGVYIVGGTPSSEYLKSAEGFPNIHFVEFKEKNELSDYYSAADLFILPTREDIWGLVINEAMAFMLPVITTNKCIAGLQLVSDNGYIVETEDAEAIVQKANIILNNPIKYSINSFKRIQSYTIEKMAKRHIEVLLDNEN